MVGLACLMGGWIVRGLFTSILSGLGFLIIVVAVEYIKRYNRDRRKIHDKVLISRLLRGEHVLVPVINNAGGSCSQGRILSRGQSLSSGLFAAYKQSGNFLSFGCGYFSKEATARRHSTRLDENEDKDPMVRFKSCQSDHPNLSISSRQTLSSVQTIPSEMHVEKRGRFPTRKRPFQAGEKRHSTVKLWSSENFSNRLATQSIGKATSYSTFAKGTLRRDLKQRIVKEYPFIAAFLNDKALEKAAEREKPAEVEVRRLWSDRPTLVSTKETTDKENVQRFKIYIGGSSTDKKANSSSKLSVIRESDDRMVTSSHFLQSQKPIQRCESSCRTQAHHHKRASPLFTESRCHNMAKTSSAHSQCENGDHASQLTNGSKKMEKQKDCSPKNVSVKMDKQKDCSPENGWKETDKQKDCSSENGSKEKDKQKDCSLEIVSKKINEQQDCSPENSPEIHHRIQASDASLNVPSPRSLRKFSKTRLNSRSKKKAHCGKEDDEKMVGITIQYRQWNQIKPAYNGSNKWPFTAMKNDNKINVGNPAISGASTHIKLPSRVTDSSTKDKLTKRDDCPRKRKREAKKKKSKKLPVTDESGRCLPALTNPLNYLAPHGDNMSELVEYGYGLQSELENLGVAWYVRKLIYGDSMKPACSVKLAGSTVQPSSEAVLGTCVDSLSFCSSRPKHTAIESLLENTEERVGTFDPPNSTSQPQYTAKTAEHVETQKHAGEKWEKDEGNYKKGDVNGVDAGLADNGVKHVSFLPIVACRSIRKRRKMKNPNHPLGDGKQETRDQRSSIDGASKRTKRNSESSQKAADGKQKATVKENTSNVSLKKSKEKWRTNSDLLDAQAKQKKMKEFSKLRKAKNVPQSVLNHESGKPFLCGSKNRKLTKKNVAQSDANVSITSQRSLPGRHSSRANVKEQRTERAQQKVEVTDTREVENEATFTEIPTVICPSKDTKENNSSNGKLVRKYAKTKKKKIPLQEINGVNTEKTEEKTSKQCKFRKCLLFRNKKDKKCILLPSKGLNGKIKDHHKGKTTLEQSANTKTAMMPKEAHLENCQAAMHDDDNVCVQCVTGSRNTSLSDKRATNSCVQCVIGTGNTSLSDKGAMNTCVQCVTGSRNTSLSDKGAMTKCVQCDTGSRNTSLSDKGAMNTRSLCDTGSRNTSLSDKGAMRDNSSNNLTSEPLENGFNNARDFRPRRENVKRRNSVFEHRLKTKDTSRHSWKIKCSWNNLSKSEGDFKATKLRKYDVGTARTEKQSPFSFFNGRSRSVDQRQCDSNSSGKQNKPTPLIREGKGKVSTKRTNLEDFLKTKSEVRERGEIYVKEDHTKYLEISNKFNNRGRLVKAEARNVYGCQNTTFDCKTETADDSSKLPTSKNLVSPTQNDNENAASERDIPSSSSGIFCSLKAPSSETSENEKKIGRNRSQTSRKNIKGGISYNKCSTLVPLKKSGEMTGGPYEDLNNDKLNQSSVLGIESKKVVHETNRMGSSAIHEDNDPDRNNDGVQSALDVMNEDKSCDMSVWLKLIGQDRAPDQMTLADKAGCKGLFEITSREQGYSKNPSPCSDTKTLSLQTLSICSSQPSRKENMSSTTPGNNQPLPEASTPPPDDKQKPMKSCHENLPPCSQQQKKNVAVEDDAKDESVSFYSSVSQGRQPFAKPDGKNLFLEALQKEGFLNCEDTSHSEWLSVKDCSKQECKPVVHDERFRDAKSSSSSTSSSGSSGKSPRRILRSKRKQGCDYRRPSSLQFVGDADVADKLPYETHTTSQRSISLRKSRLDKIVNARNKTTNPTL